MKTNILILGAGYAGVNTALHLQKQLIYQEANITLVNKHDYHYFTTQLHESAAGTTSHNSVKIDIDELIDSDMINFIKEEVISIDINNQKVMLKSGKELTYDFLVVALGSEIETFGIKGLREHAFSIRSINSVLLIKEHIDYMFARYKSDGENADNLTFVVGGAGFTGIEFVGELADRIPKLCEQFDIAKDRVKIINIEAAESPLPGFDPHLIDYAIDVLKNKGVQFILNRPIKECTDNGIILDNGEEIKTRTIIWTGGVRGNKVIETMGVDNIRSRIKVDENLNVSGYKNVFVIGDNSIIFDEKGKPYPPTAQMATQQAVYLANKFYTFIKTGEMPNSEFQFKQKGVLASLGKHSAIGKIGKYKLSGYTASFLKQMVDNRYLYSIGGLPLVIKKGKIL